MPTEIVLDGCSLTVADVAAVARNGAAVRIADGAARVAEAARDVVDAAVASGATIYGVNTGFGRLQNVRIPPDQLRQLQRNLVVSHAAGVGDPLPREIVRAAMLLRANVLIRPTSGVRVAIAQRLVDLLHAGMHPVVPEQGSVGASGDLVPLAHVALAMIGEGDVEQGGRIVSAADALKRAGLEPIEFLAKEALSFINGTQMQSAVLALAVHDARNLWRSAHVAAAMSIEALRGTPDPFDARLHAERPHPGQVQSAALLASLLADSEIRESHRQGDSRVQDAYSLRCTPQVLGTVFDTIEFAATTLGVELNASTDNPLVIGDTILSGGNFHGQPVALALDVVAIALTTLAGMAERRLDRLMNPDLSHGLPAFLAPDAGLQSGFMMVQVVAAALVAESRTLCMPASIQSIPTEANQEDFVPMGMAAAFKVRRVLANAQRVVAAELMCAAQGLEFLKPLRPSARVASAVERVRAVVAPLESDRALSADLEALRALLQEGALA
ncbi:MAG TPA: histidine ammonia-lyase [Gemmatimonadales bacterium]